MKAGLLTRWQAAARAHLPGIEDAPGLTPAERARVQRSLAAGLRALAVEYVWRRALGRLKRRLAALGLRFVGELLDRRDVEETWLPEAALSDGDALTLAESFGLLDPAAALRLHQAFEEVCALVAGDTPGEPDPATTAEILAACAGHLLAGDDSASVERYRAFRDRLSAHRLAPDDAQTRRLAASSPFYLHVTLRTLLAVVRSSHGDPLHHALENLQVLLPLLWPRLAEEDRWTTGFVYAEMAAEGKPDAVTGLRDALLAADAFAYVPDDVSADPFRRAAQLAVAAHGTLDRADAEARAVRRLLALGDAIPRPALIGTVRACVALSLSGADTAARARERLERLSDDDWLTYLDAGLPRDALVLAHLARPDACARFARLLMDRDLPAAGAPPRAAQVLAAVHRREPALAPLVTRFWRQLHGLTSGAQRRARGARRP